MKNKNKTYLLLAIVLVVWGILGLKIVGAINPEPNEDHITVITEKFVPKAIKKRDTFSIVANYRDPFLGTLPKGTHKKKRVAPKKEKLPEKNILYSGSIMDAQTKKRIFFVNIDGQQHMLSKNDAVDEVRLVSGNTNWIKVKYQGKTKTISLTP